MKIVKLFISFVSALVLVSMASCNNSCPKANCPMVGSDSTSTSISIAYVKMDSLLRNYNVYKKMSEELISEEEKAKLNLNQKAAALQKEVEEFQNKVQHNAFLNESRMMSEQERLLRKQKDIQELSIKLEQELISKQQKMVEQLNLVIDSVITAYNTDAKYDFIISNSNVLYGAEKFNITSEILEILNAEK